MIPAELQLKMTEWRLKAADGTLTPDEMKEAIKVLREGRVSAAYASDTARRKKAIVEIPHADALLAELDNL